MNSANDNSIAGLERTYAARILLLLHREGPLSRTIIYSKMSSAPRTPQDRIEELFRMGLLKETPRPSNPRVMLIDLTERGRKVAKHLSEIEELLRAG